MRESPKCFDSSFLNVKSFLFLSDSKLNFFEFLTSSWTTSLHFSPFSHTFYKIILSCSSDPDQTTGFLLPLSLVEIFPAGHVVIEGFEHLVADVHLVSVRLLQMFCFFVKVLIQLCVTKWAVTPSITTTWAIHVIFNQFFDQKNANDMFIQRVIYSEYTPQWYIR